MLSGLVYNVQDDRPEVVRILCGHGSQVGESSDENCFTQTTETDRTECGKGAVGKEGREEE